MDVEMYNIIIEQYARYVRVEHGESNIVIIVEPPGHAMSVCRDDNSVVCCHNDVLVRNNDVIDFKSNSWL